MRASKTTIACLATLVLVAAMAGSALASEWVIEDETLSALSLKEEKITVSTGLVQFGIPGLSSTIKCPKGTGSGKILSGGSGEATITLSECEASKACKATKPVVMEAKIELIPVGSIIYYQLTALKETAPLVTFVFGEECAIGETLQMKGAVAAEPIFEESVQQTLTLSEAISKQANKELAEEKSSEIKLSYGKQVVYPSGVITATLSGARAGQDFQLASPTKLCKVNQANNVCPAGQNWPMGTTISIENVTPMKFSYNGRVNTCTESKMTGATNAAVAAPLTVAMNSDTLTGCSCTTSVVTPPPPAPSFEFWRATKGNGPFDILRLEFEFRCNNLTCAYKASRTEFWTVGGEGGATPATAWRAPMTLVKDPTLSEGGCDGTASWKGEVANQEVKYKFLEPGPPGEPGKLFVSG